MARSKKYDVQKAVRLFKLGAYTRGFLFEQVVELVDRYGADVEMPKLPEELLEDFMNWVTQDRGYDPTDARPEEVACQQKLDKVCEWYENRGTAK